MSFQPPAKKRQDGDGDKDGIPDAEDFQPKIPNKIDPKFGETELVPAAKPLDWNADNILDKDQGPAISDFDSDGTPNPEDPTPFKASDTNDIDQDGILNEEDLQPMIYNEVDLKFGKDGVEDTEDDLNDNARQGDWNGDNEKDADADARDNTTTNDHDADNVPNDLDPTPFPDSLPDPTPTVSSTPANPIPTPTPIPTSTSTDTIKPHHERILQNCGPVPYRPQGKGQEHSIEPPRVETFGEKPFLAQCEKSTRLPGTYECVNAPPIKKAGGGSVVAAAVLGVGFGLALLVLGWVLWKRKRSRGQVHNEVTHQAYVGGVGGNEKALVDLQAERTALATKLHEANTNTERLQAALLVANTPDTKFLPRNPRDDRQFGQEFEQITQEIKDYTGNYFKARAGVGINGDIAVSQVSVELATVLGRVLPGWDQLLRDEGARGKVLVVRAAVWSMLQKAWEDGEIFGKLGFEQMTVQMAVAEQADPSDLHLWRRTTFALLLNSPTFNSTKAQAVNTITTQIDSMLSPLAYAPPSQERYQFLYGIISKASNLAMELKLQVADYRILTSGFRLESGYELPSHFKADTMDDVQQSYQTTVGKDGSLRNALEGSKIRGVMSPAIMKWGNARGENWEQNTVVTKAKVLV